MLSYVLAGVGCAFAGLCYAEFASLIPIAGSAYTYGYATLGEIVAWIIGWDLILEYAFGAATVASGWCSTLVAFLQDYGINLPPQICDVPGARWVFRRPMGSGGYHQPHERASAQSFARNVQLQLGGVSGGAGCDNNSDRGNQGVRKFQYHDRVCETHGGGDLYRCSGSLRFPACGRRARELEWFYRRTPGHLGPTDGRGYCGEQELYSSRTSALTRCPPRRKKPTYGPALVSLDGLGQVSDS